MADNFKQHIAPRFYIAFFHADADERVFVRVKGVPGILLKSPKGQGYEEDAFTVMKDGERDTSCDDANKIIEDWCSPHLTGLTAALPPNDDQWRAVWYLTANLVCRSRWTRDHNLWQMEQVQKVLPDIIEVLKDVPPLPEAVRHFGLSPDQLNEVCEVLDGAAKLQFPLTAALGAVPVADELKTGKDCDLLVAPAGAAFITSDEPAIVLDGGRPVITKIAPGFLARAEVEVYLPLKPNIACNWSARSGRCRRSVTADEVAEYNRLVWENCYDRVFASRRIDLELL
jgi:hypothetical protein